MNHFAIIPLDVAWIDAVVSCEAIVGDTRWSRPQFEKELSLPLSQFYVMVKDRELMGYGGFWNVQGEAQITNFLIHPAYRRKGNGRNLLSYLVQQARQAGCARMTLEVREHNPAALALYRTAGFIQTGRRPQVYVQPVEDAVLMEMAL